MARETKVICEWCGGSGRVEWCTWDGSKRSFTGCSRCDGEGRLEPLAAALEALVEMRQVITEAAKDSAHARVWLRDAGHPAVAASFALQALAEGNYVE